MNPKPRTMIAKHHKFQWKQVRLFFIGPTGGRHLQHGTLEQVGALVELDGLGA